MAGCVITLLLVLAALAVYASPAQFVVLVAAVVALGVWWVASKRRYSPASVKKRLMAKYGNEQLVLDIMQRRCWIGQTQEQLLDALGYPQAKDVKQTAHSRRETWQYKSLRITLEDEVVTAWQSHEGP